MCGFFLAYSNSPLNSEHSDHTRARARVGSEGGRPVIAGGVVGATALPSGPWDSGLRAAPSAAALHNAVRCGAVYRQALGLTHTLCATPPPSNPGPAFEGGGCVCVGGGGVNTLRSNIEHQKRPKEFRPSIFSALKGLSRGSRGGRGTTPTPTAFCNSASREESAPVHDDCKRTGAFRPTHRRTRRGTQ